MVAVRLGLSSGSFSSSHSQSTISSTFSSTTKRISPFAGAAGCACSSPSSRPGCSTSPGSPCALAGALLRLGVGADGSASARGTSPAPAPCGLPAPRHQVRARDRTRAACPCTASRTFSLCRSQSRAPREKRSYQRRLCGDPDHEPGSLLREQRGHVVQRFARAVRVVAVLVDQPLLDHRDLLARLVVGPRGSRSPGAARRGAARTGTARPRRAAARGCRA